jgi:hypothetical protein
MREGREPENREHAAPAKVLGSKTARGQDGRERRRAWMG